MSAPSPETSMQTPQREFAVQNYNKKMTYANKNEKNIRGIAFRTTDDVNRNKIPIQ